MGQAVCAVAPAASTKKPGDAPTQADESFTATAPEYVPGMHGMQSAIDVAPLLDWKVPAGHGFWLDAPGRSVK
jgi:hypothetical protein